MTTTTTGATTDPDANPAPRPSEVGPRPQVLVAAPTGFTADGALDLDASAAILAFAADSGVDGLFATGTTGEFPALDRAERRDLTRLAVEAFADRTLVVHAGAASAAQTIELVADARGAGARSVAAITPYYLRVSEEGIVEHYRRICAAAPDVDVYAYVFAACTNNPVPPALLARLAEIPGLVGAKITGETLQTLSAYRAAVGPEFVLYTGSDVDVAGTTAHGARGVVSGCSSAFPELFARMADAAGAGDEAEVARLQRAVDDVAAAVAGSPERLKVALTLRGVHAGTSRLALWPVDDSARAELARCVDAYR